MKKIILIAFICFLSLFLVGCGEWEQPESASNATPNPATQTSQVFNIGEPVKLGNKILTVYGVSDYTETNEFMQPQAGNKYVAVDVSIENQTSEPISYNVLDFEIQDENGFKYQSAFAAKEPDFGSGTLQPSRSVRGFVTFEIPVSITSLELIYTPNWTDFSQAIVKLK